MSKCVSGLFSGTTGEGRAHAAGMERRGAKTGENDVVVITNNSLEQLRGDHQSLSNINTLMVKLEYRCYPVWNYDPQGNLVENNLPVELRSNQELDNLFVSIQNKYDSCFFMGFESDEAQASFLELISKAVFFLKEAAGENYVIVNSVAL